MIPCLHIILFCSTVPSSSPCFWAHGRKELRCRFFLRSDPGCPFGPSCAFRHAKPPKNLWRKWTGGGGGGEGRGGVEEEEEEEEREEKRKKTGQRRSRSTSRGDWVGKCLRRSARCVDSLCVCDCVCVCVTVLLVFF